MKPTTYKEAGVDLEAGEAFTSKLRTNAALTIRPEVLGSLGSFAGFFQLPSGYDNPVLVSCTDGVGSKLLLALGHSELLQHVGQDLVAMVVNDMICSGAEPLFFLDYFATGKLQGSDAEWFLQGVTDSLIHCNMALLGGETAELPGMYKKGHFDAAGFGVGIVERDKIISGANVEVGDAVIGLTSSGPHANGFSLIRKILATQKLRGKSRRNIIEKLMKPTTLYHTAILPLQEVCEVKAIANITGGGLFENVPRVVEPYMKVAIDGSAWDVPEIFHWIQQKGNVDWYEMYRVFNMGIGMVLVVDPADVKTVLDEMEHDAQIQAIKIGDIIPNDGGTNSVIIV